MRLEWMICYPSALKHLNKLAPTISVINVAVIMHEAIMQLKLHSNLLKWEYFLKIILELFSEYTLEQVDGLRGSKQKCGTFLPRSSVCLQLKSILTKYYPLCWLLLTSGRRQQGLVCFFFFPFFPLSLLVKCPHHSWHWVFQQWGFLFEECGHTSRQETWASFKFAVFHCLHAEYLLVSDLCHIYYNKAQQYINPDFSLRSEFLYI